MLEDNGLPESSNGYAAAANAVADLVRFEQQEKQEKQLMKPSKKRELGEKIHSLQNCTTALLVGKSKRQRVFINSRSTTQ